MQFAIFPYSQLLPSQLVNFQHQMSFVNQLQFVVDKIQLQMQEAQTLNSVRNSLNCSSEYPADLICCSAKCQKFPFMCRVKECKCISEIHRNCVYRSLDGLLENIYQKKGKIGEAEQKSFDLLIKIYRQLIQRLSRDLEDLIVRMSLFGLKKYESKFISLIEQGKFSEINGNLMNEVNNQSAITHQLRLMSESEITKYWEVKGKEFNKICDSLELISHENRVFAFQSKILENLIIVEKFFDRPLLKLNLLYRASEDNFQVANFHKKCDGVPNTLILIRTEYDKIIGGFTPLTWDCVSDQKFCPDTTMKTFLFSVTNNQKYPLIKADSGIGCYKNYGPIFGNSAGCDLVIAGGANNNRTSHIHNFPVSYSNGKYNKSQATYLAFGGPTNDYNFKIKQWEVYQVIM